MEMFRSEFACLAHSIYFFFERLYICAFTSGAAIFLLFFHFISASLFVSFDIFTFGCFQGFARSAPSATKGNVSTFRF